MKTKWIVFLLSLALVLLLAACGTKTAAPTIIPTNADEMTIPADDTSPTASYIIAKFDYKNDTTTEICELYLSPAGKEQWGPDQLQGQTIAIGGTFAITNIPADSYDARWVGCDKSEGIIQVDIKQ